MRIIKIFSSSFITIITFIYGVFILWTFPDIFVPFYFEENRGEKRNGCWITVLFPGNNLACLVACVLYKIDCFGMSHDPRVWKWVRTNC